VVVTLEAWAKVKGTTLEGKKYIVQGFGNVGYWAAHFMHKNGAILVGVQDATGTIYNPEGIDPEALLRYQAENATITGFKGSVEYKSEEFFGIECDVVIPAALGNQITEDNAASIKAQVIAEGANGPTDTDGEVILRANGIDIIPDILCNSGGVIGSYFEWLQNRNGEIWTMDDVIIKLRKKLEEAFNKVITTSVQYQTDWRTAAYIVALTRIEMAYKQRGIFP
ncbi:MAG TPA: glutamate dehydrogenase, partial [Flavobacterium sp.]|nr:glutamate dehydrogenase [Flavobacterium sp.]